jgi:S-adenosylmethionine hydrolase
LLSLAARRPRAVVLRRASYFRAAISQTFHGRDIFAPVAAHLAAGASFENLGPALPRIVRLPSVRPRRVPKGLRGAVVSVDRFGNLITNLDIAHWKSVRRPRLTAGSFAATSLSPSYGAVHAGQLAVVFGGYGLLKIAVRGGSAAKILVDREF